MDAFESRQQDCTESDLAGDDWTPSKLILSYWSADEIYRVVSEIRKAVCERDLASLLDLAVGELDPGPRRAWAETQTFDQVFSEGWRESVLRDVPGGGGYRGYALGGGNIQFAKPGKGIGIYRIFGATPEPRPAIAAEWRFDGKILGPGCFRYESLSSDNVKEVQERWHIRDDRSSFTRNMGRTLATP